MNTFERILVAYHHDGLVGRGEKTVALTASEIFNNDMNSSGEEHKSIAAGANGRGKIDFISWPLGVH